MNTASPMQMPMTPSPGMMSGMPMPVPMMMPMSCHMTCSMSDQGMKCMMMPAEGMSMDMMKDLCTMMTATMKNGTAFGAPLSSQAYFCRKLAASALRCST